MLGFERSLVKVINEALRSTKTLANKEADVIKDDILEGMTAVVTVRMSNHSLKVKLRKSSVLQLPPASLPPLWLTR